jgi:hypothetical protein
MANAWNDFPPDGPGFEDFIEAATRYVDACRAEARVETLHEAADTADRMAFEMRNCEDDTWPEEWSSREVRDAVQSVGGELRRMAEEKER